MAGFSRSMVQGATAAPQAAQTVAAAAAPKPRTPAPAREVPAGREGRGAKKQEASPAPIGAVTPAQMEASKQAFLRRQELEKMGISAEQLRASTEAFKRRQSDDEFYRTKLEDVARLRAERKLGPGGSAGGAQLNPEDLARGGTANVAFVRGVQPFVTDPKSLGKPREMLPQARPGMRENYVEVPMGGPGGTLDSVAAFRRKAEELGARYKEAKRVRAMGDEEIERAKRNPATSRSTDLPRLAAAQRQRTQEFVNAREALRQLGFTDEEMRQKFGN